MKFDLIYQRSILNFLGSVKEITLRQPCSMEKVPTVSTRVCKEISILDILSVRRHENIVNCLKAMVSLLRSR